MGDLPPGRLMLSFAWAVPLGRAEANRIFEQGCDRSVLQRMDRERGRDWVASDEFLITHSQLPDRCTVTEPVLAIGVGETTIPCRIYLSWNPGYQAMTFVVAATISEHTGVDSDVARAVDLGIAVVQSMNGHSCELRTQRSHLVHGVYRGRQRTSARDAVGAAFDELTRECDLGEGLGRRGWCVEFRGFDGSPPVDTVAADPRPFYGLATGDEGWRFVPVAVAEEALGTPWGTRSFVAAYPLAEGIVCFNNKGAAYTDSQRNLGLTYFGAAERYFDLDSDVAGLDHGVLFALERVLVRMALADQWLHRAQQEPRYAAGQMLPDRTNRLLRSSLDDILDMLKSVLLPEVDRLERRLVTAMGVERVIQQLDRQAEAMDEETRYHYESLVSARVTRLTLVAVILTIVTIVVGVLQIVVSV